MNSLLIRKRPQDDESLWGYLIRLTEDNCYEDISWILSLAGIKGNRHSGTSSRHFFTSENKLFTLSKLIGITTDKLMSMTYPPAGPEVYLKEHLFFDNPVPRLMIRVFSPKICPNCLAESNYIRRIWDYLLITACPVHYCLLVTTCQKCQRKIDARRCKVSECDCGFDWRDSRPTILKEGDLRLAKRIYQLCGQLEEPPVSTLRQNDLADASLAGLSRSIYGVIERKRVIDSSQSWASIKRSGIELFHETINKSVDYFDYRSIFNHTMTTSNVRLFAWGEC
jgi:hypothetical protein